MRMMTKVVLMVGVLALAVPSIFPKPKAPAPDDESTVVIVFKDGHRQTFRLSEIARIEFSPSSSVASAPGRATFLGVWKVGIGSGNSGTFLITLKPDGVAEKTIGSHGGKWKVVNGAARCSWDDGWTDVIRKVGGRWEKAAYSPGSSLDGEPTGVAEAVYTEAH